MGATALITYTVCVVSGAGAAVLKVTVNADNGSKLKPVRLPPEVVTLTVRP